MKKLIIFAAVLSIFACAKKEEPKVVFAYFTGYRCPWCVVFENAYLNDFQKTYKEKYGGRIELRIYKVDVPFQITKDSPEYEDARKLAKRNDSIMMATSKLHNAKWVGSIPFVVVGESFLDGEDLSDITKVDAAIDKALANNEITKLADETSGKMESYDKIWQAVTVEDYAAIEEFVKKGADINDAMGQAAFLGKTEMIDWLMSKGAKIEDKLIPSAGYDENMIAYLKKLGANINGVLSEKGTPLTRVIINGESKYPPEVFQKYLQALINQGADVNKKVTIKDEKGKDVTKTPLQIAQKKETKDFLISKGAK